MHWLFVYKMVKNPLSISFDVCVCPKFFALMCDHFDKRKIINIIFEKYNNSQISSYQVDFLISHEMFEMFKYAQCKIILNLST